jgi:hypothetical protein
MFMYMHLFRWYDHNGSTFVAGHVAFGISSYNRPTNTVREVLVSASLLWLATVA